MARLVFHLLVALFRELRQGNPTVLAALAILAGVGAGLAVVRAFRQGPELPDSPAPGLDFADEPRPWQDERQMIDDTWQMTNGR